MAFSTFNGQATAMSRHDVFDDGEPKTRAFNLSTAAFINPIKALAQPRQV